MRIDGQATVNGDSSGINNIGIETKGRRSTSPAPPQETHIKCFMFRKKGPAAAR